MRFATSFLRLAASLAFATHVLTLSIRVDSPGNGAGSVKIPKLEVVSFSYVGNEVMAPHEVELVRRVKFTYSNNQNLVMAVIVKNAVIITATCRNGNAVTCAIGATYSVFAFLFAAFAWSDRRADTLDGPNPFFVIGPTPTQTLRQRLTTELAAGEWHYVGYAHHLGANHTVHYLNHGGGVHQLRARTAPFAQATDVHDKRYDENNDGGFVADYYWNSDNEGPYDSFGSSSSGTEFFAQNAADYMIDSVQGVSACAGFTDAQGPLDNGILAYGWNDQPYLWQDGQLQSQFDSCASELGDGPQ